MKTKLLLLLILSCLQIKAQCLKTAAAGYNHNVIIKKEGTLWAWGNNGNGQIGNGTSVTQTVPTMIGTANDWKAVTAGWGHTVALKTDGSLWAWGYGTLGQIGNGTNSAKPFNLPQQIGSANDWQTIAAGAHYTVAIKTDGTLWTWGYNSDGQLGDGTIIDKNTPTQIGTANDWAAIAPGSSHTVALKKDGSLWAWGDNTYGQLGDNTLVDKTVPTQIGTATDWKAISTGNDHTTAIKTDGTLWVWGNNINGALGDGTKTNKIVPTQMGTSTSWKTITAGWENTFAIKTDGSLWGWGNNQSGKLGDGTKVSTVAPIQIGTTNNWSVIFCGYQHTIALKTDGDLWDWGGNAANQLGDGTTLGKNAPILMSCPGGLMELTVAISKVNISCAGSADGLASVTSVSGGTAPYTYLWSNGKTTSTITELFAGDYSCTITDANSLSSIKNITITQPAPIILATAITNASCNDNNDGILTVMATGGTPPYIYSLSSSSYQGSNIFAGLSPGFYTISTRDANGCTASNTTTLLSNSTPPPTASAQTFDNGSTAASLQAAGLNIKWFDVITAGDILSLSTILQTGKYYASQTINGCESARIAVDVTITPVSVNEPIPTNGLLAYYPFNANANDESGNQNNGNVTDVTLTSDRFGNSNSAYSFNGTTSNIEADVKNYPLKGGSRTITGWFKADNPTNSKELDFCILNYGNVSDPDHWFKMSLYLKGYLDVQFDSDTFSSQENYLNNQWTFFAMVFNDDTNTFSIYINNVLKLSGSADLYTNGLGNLFRIGKNKSNNYFEGSIDDIGIWDRALTQEEITRLYNIQDETNLYTLIPDVNFENKLIELGIDSGDADGKVLKTNIASVTNLDLNASSISDLSGIQDFTSLTNLNCENNQLSNLDITNNTALVSLYCGYNELTSLDVSKNTALTALYLNYNKVTDLDVSKNTALITLYAENNLLSNLNVTSNTALETISCAYNELTSLDVSKNIALVSLYFHSNKVTSIDVSKNTALGVLYFTSNSITHLDTSKNTVLQNLITSDNPLNTIDVSKNTALQFLNCDNNNLTDLDVSKNPSLSTLSCNNNNLTTLDISVNTALRFFTCNSNQFTNLDISKNTKLTRLECSSNKLTSLDISKNTALFLLYCDSNQLTDLDISKNIALQALKCNSNQLISLNLKNGNNVNFSIANFTNNPDLTCIQVDDVAYSNTNWSAKKDAIASYNVLCELVYTLIPDTKFEQKLIDLGLDKDGINGKILKSNVTSVTSLNISNAGIKDLTGIEDFEALETLSVSGDSIKALDLSKNLKLKTLYSNSGKMQTLNISNNLALTYLECYNNHLKSLDVSKNVALTYLQCSQNELVTLDISKNTNLKALLCESNQLTSLNLKNGSNKLLGSSPNYEISFKNNPALSCIQVDDESYSNTNWSDKKDVAATYNTNCTVEYVSLPDSNFEQKLIDLGIDTDGLNGKVTVADISTITYLDVSNSNIKDLTGIENFTALTYLDCSQNQLTSLDVSHNILLETLNASSNQITSLDLSKNSKLTIVYVVSNPLAFLNLQNGNNKNMIIFNINGKKTENSITTTFLGLNKLGCIKVDDADFSNANWSKIKESTTIYSSTCSLGIGGSVFDKVVLYPNPTKGEVTINNITLEKANVYNVLGQLVKSFILNSNNASNTLYLSDLPKGVYYIYLINQDAASAKKIIIE